jgi:hypothetical protein
MRYLIPLFIDTALLQNRYKSILCEEGSYLLELVRYIHLNPLRAAVVKSMRELGHMGGAGNKC